MKLTDLRLYAKFLVRNKVYTIVSVVGFSVSLMFVIILGVYVRQEFSVDRFHEKKDRIYIIGDEEGNSSSNPLGPYIQERFAEVESFTRAAFMRAVILTPAGEKVNADAMFADSTFFNIFSFKLEAGDPSKVLSREKSMVITRSFADKIFGDRNPVGQYLNLRELSPVFQDLRDQDVVITGIMESFPPDTHIAAHDFILSYDMVNCGYWGEGDILNSWGNSSFTIYFLAKEGMDLPARSEDIKESVKDIYFIYRDGYVKELIFTPLLDIYFDVNGVSSILSHSGNKTLITVYMGIAILILVIAMLNYINMTVAQAGFRGKEAALKKVLGCPRSLIISQLLFESFLMTLFAFLIGIILAVLSEPFFNEVLSTNLNIIEEVNVTSISGATAFIVIISIICGFVPALVISSFDPLDVIKGKFSKKIKTGYSKVLIVFQYTVCTALLICTFFIVRQSHFLLSHDPGYKRDNILIMNNSVWGNGREEGLRNVLKSVPGVELLAFTHGTPLDGGNNNTFELNGTRLSFQIFNADSAFIEIFGLNIIYTTGIVPSSDTYWVNEHGYQTLQANGVKDTFSYWDNTWSIAGVVKDFNLESLREGGVDNLFIRLRKEGDYAPRIVIKILEGVSLYETAQAIQKAYSKYTGGETPSWSFAEDTTKEWYAKEERMTKIMGAFTGLTILIMIMGVFAMSLYMIRQKQKEIAIRKVNGSTVGEILGMLNKQSLRQVLAAFIIACPIAYYAVSRWLEGFAYRISLTWWVFIVAGLILLALSMLSVSWQSWAAARRNPVESLKGE